MEFSCRNVSVDVDSDINETSVSMRGRTSYIKELDSFFEYSEGTMEKVTFGAGCFWGVEAAFRRIDGVIDAPVGYAGGTVRNPTYENVCGGETGHAEVVEVAFDPERVGIRRLLDVFWACHDPTQLNRQGWDVGSQYRSVIFFHTPEQETEAKASLEAFQASGKVKGNIVTEISPADDFWRAEDYHQRYFEKHGGH